MHGACTVGQSLRPFVGLGGGGIYVLVREQIVGPDATQRDATQRNVEAQAGRHKGRRGWANCFGCPFARRPCAYTRTGAPTRLSQCRRCARID